MHFFSRLAGARACSLLIVFVLGFALLSSTRLSTYAVSSTSFKPSPRPRTATPTSALTCGSWSVVLNPHIVHTYLPSFGGVAAISANDVWAVGSFHAPGGALTEHWNGTKWSIVPSASGRLSSSYNLKGVAALSANDVWAVGFVSSRNFQTLIEHWNGISWKVIPSPNLSSYLNILNAVAAISTNDVWAVGQHYEANKSTLQLIEHWDGTSWKIFPSPNVLGSTLEGVAAISANDIWAVGSDATGMSTTEHWDGTSWKVALSPVISHLFGVAALSTSNVWAVGSNGATLVEHWDGISWKVVPSPNPKLGNGFYLTAIAATSVNDIWAVGLYDNSYSGQTLIEHWDGTSWKIFPRPEGGERGDLSGVVSVQGPTSTSQLWAVGSNGGYSPLTEFYC